MLKMIERTQGRAARAAAEARLAPKQSEAERQADNLAALPTSVAAAKGDVRAHSKADMKRQVAAAMGEAVPGSAGASASRKSMLAELKRQGMEPVR